MVYLSKMVIFHGYVSHNQMVIIIFTTSPFFRDHFLGPIKMGTRCTRMINEKMRMRMVMMKYDVWPGKGDGEGGIGGRKKKRRRKRRKGRMRESVFS